MASYQLTQSESSSTDNVLRANMQYASSAQDSPAASQDHLPSATSSPCTTRPPSPQLPPAFPPVILTGSASTTDLPEAGTSPILSPLQRRSTLRQTKSSLSMRISTSGPSPPSNPTSPASSPARPRNTSRSSSPAISIERKPVPSSPHLLSNGGGIKVRKLRPSSLSPAPSAFLASSSSRSVTPTSVLQPRTPPPVPFSANSTPALTQESSFISSPQPPYSVNVGERARTPPLQMLGKVKSPFGSPRRHDLPSRINTSLGDEAKGKETDPTANGAMISFFSPISSDEEEERFPTPKKVRSMDGSKEGGSGNHARKTTILLGSLENITGGNKDGDGKKKKEKEGQRRRVSAFGAGNFKRFWERKDNDAESKGAVSPVPLAPPAPPFLNKATNRASSPISFTRKKDKLEKKEKKEKKDREKEKEKEKDTVKDAIREKGIKISNPIPHPDPLQIVYPLSPQFPPGQSGVQHSQQTPASRTRQLSLSFIPQSYHHTPTVVYPPSQTSGTSSSYSPRPSSDTAPSMSTFTSASTGHHTHGGLTDLKESRMECPTSPRMSFINPNTQRGGAVTATLSPNPQYTQPSQQGLRPHSGHVRTMSAPSITLTTTNMGPPRTVQGGAPLVVPAGAGWKFPASAMNQQRHQPPLSPRSAQELLHTLHQSLETVERNYAHVVFRIGDMDLEERLVREIDAVEKRLKSQKEIISGIKREMEERKRRRDSKLRKEQEGEFMHATKETHSESERSYFSSDSDDEGADGEDNGNLQKTTVGVEKIEKERDWVHGDVRYSNTVEMIGSHARPNLSIVEEDASGGDDPFVMRSPQRVDTDTTIRETSIRENSPWGNGEELQQQSNSIYHSQSSPRLSALKRTDTDITITTTDSASGRSSQVVTSPLTRSTPRRRPVKSLARQTFGEEFASLGRRSVLPEAQDSAVCSTPSSTSASAVPRYTPTLTEADSSLPASPSQDIGSTPLAAIRPVGLGITSPSFPHISTLAVTAAMRSSSSSSFSFESSDVEKQHHTLLQPQQTQQASKLPSASPELKDKEDKVVRGLKQKFEEKRGIYYHQQSTSNTSITTGSQVAAETSVVQSGYQSSQRTVQSASRYYPQLTPVAGYQQHEQHPQSGRAMSPVTSSDSHITAAMFPSPPQHKQYSPAGGSHSYPQSPYNATPQTSVYGRNSPRQPSPEEVVRERAISPEGILIASRGGYTVGEAYGPGVPEKRVMVEGVELVMI
ncbi:hypothetical protein BDZ91DRAFT_564927 [Kalaharituber pfeilii]|nr:hypothetical protein BDZ91DRAFT_564927 [Kalaharituber pfeilii]